jgi:hypothetical protein
MTPAIWCSSVEAAGPELVAFQRQVPLRVRRIGDAAPGSYVSDICDLHD